MSFPRRLLPVISGVVALLLAGLVLLYLFLPRRGETRGDTSPAVLQPAHDGAPLHDEPPGDERTAVQPSEDGDAPPRPEITLEPLTDEVARRAIRFRELRREVPARLTLDGIMVRDALNDPELRETRMLTALLHDSPGEDEDPFLQFLDAPARQYLPRELRQALAAAFTENGEVRAMYLVEDEDDRDLTERVQFVLFSRESAALIILYLREELVTDGEVIPREWSSRRTLATGSSGAPILFP